MAERKLKWDGWWEYNENAIPSKQLVWHSYSGPLAYELEKAYRENRNRLDLSIEGQKNNFDFVSMTQTNTITKFQRQIRRLDTRFGGLHWGRKKGKLPQKSII
eukprot:m.340971 g.340971  ORF g.340971 m.340971 type:complete len:103 (+) comp19675_c0_seq1:65-373(+)